MPETYLDALLAELRACPPRAVPEPALLRLAGLTRAPQLRALLDVLAAVEPRRIRVGELTIAQIDDSVPSAEDPDEDRTNVLMIGVSPGGDPYCVQRPDENVSDEGPWIYRILHGAGWISVPLVHGLDAMVESFVAEARRKGERTDLDDRLGPLREAAVERWYRKP